MNKFLLISFSLIAYFVTGGKSTADEALQFFENEIRPLLAAECYDCHGPDKTKGGLRLDHVNYIKKGGDTGPAIVAGDPGNSLLIEAIHQSDPDFSMPPKKKLTARQIASLEKWVKLGAPWPATDLTEAEEVDEKGFTKKDYQWWAVQPVSDRTPPVDYGKDWAKNAIDHFIARKLEQAQLKPAPEASRGELIRRAYLDLHGLPPTPEQVTAFKNDKRPDAWERVIDELLESPKYGERWAQHWLDVVRYSESDGYRADGYRKGTWKYRDYVIRSFNEDKPYDQFVREQLAGDELDPHDPDTIIATAFLRLGIYEWNQRNARMQWDLIMTEMTNATAEAFLGIGIGCAQCHDHKFDPILQKDHFALQAFLNTVWWPERQLIGTPEQMAQQKKWEDATAKVREEIEEMKSYKWEGTVKGVVKQFPADVQEIYNKPESKRTAYEEQIAQLVQRQVDERWYKINWEKEFEKSKEAKLDRYKKLLAKLASFDDLKPKGVDYGFISTDVKPVPADTLLAKRGKKAVVEPAFLTLLGQPAPKIESSGPTTGRRTALADWIADSTNPLSTRVITNRIWQYHFAKGLAKSPNDFGKLGGTPSHPELLDWLTTRFIENDWSIKSMHRLIMTSATYRQTARREPTLVAKKTDPGNDLLWRYPPKRLSAEQVRDSMLAISGELNPKIGGAAESASSTRRSIYTQKKRNNPDPFLASFDAPAGFSSAPDRVPTTTPNQSLYLVNGSWPMARARAFAKRILGNKSTIDHEAVSQAFLLAYGREPTKEEATASIGFIEAQSAHVAPVETPPKYPNETGIRDINQHFSDHAKPMKLGKKALWLQPGSRFQQLDFTSIELPSETFTIEAVANLDTIHADASVNTLVSKWNGSKSHHGFTFGVTSAKSAYQPRNFIMQLVGENFQGNTIYEVVASDLRFPLRKPVYFAASVSAIPADGDAISGKVTFYMKDLADPKAKLQKAEVKHSVVSGLKKEAIKSFVGGRQGTGHLWDGQLARLCVSHGALSEDQLFINGGNAEKIVFNWDFSDANSKEPVQGTAWYRKTTSKQGDSKVLSATIDFCHALLNSNEFLYLH